MQYSSKFYQFLFVSFSILLVPTAYACKSQDTPISENYNFVHYYLNRSGVQVFPTETEIRGGGSDSPLGEFFFALAAAKSDKTDRVRLGKYDDDKGCFTSILGWVNRKDLIEGYSSISVKDLVAVDTRLRKPNTVNNTLYAKVLSLPEIKYEPQTYPGGTEEAFFK